ncbi:hypothetical protein [Bradyrhizobium sp.]|uniref:hypothetical protein n=1 Tax=Bradyrhizobium sp. TaxID=376 RepID=UPI0025C4C5C9|nr:hypothetical protein [Bradyrhizobium sp.]
MAGFFDILFGGGAEREAAERNRALYDQYGKAGTGYLDAGMTGSRDALASAKGQFAPLSSLYNRGSGLYADALGVNGATGNANAQAAFTTSPGYQQGIDAGIDVLNRRRAAGGMLNSGNADIDALTFGQNAQNKEWNNWLSNLGGYDTKAMGAAGAMAGVDTGLANLYQTDATNRIGLQGNITSGNANANQMQAQGEARGASNLLGGIMGGAQMLMGGGGLSSLGGAFGFGGGGGAGNYGQTQNSQIGGYSMPMWR